MSTAICGHTPSVRCENCMTVGPTQFNYPYPISDGTTYVPPARPHCEPHCWCSERGRGGMHAAYPMKLHVVCCRCGALALAPEAPHSCRECNEARDAGVISSPHICSREAP